ncbi:UNVERIFIED_CONTAM: hypothetical protein FKN15_032493 [Acipenser sinensis]
MSFSRWQQIAGVEVAVSWYFLLCVNYFFYGETVTDYFSTLVQREEPLRILSKYHRFISFTLYLTGFCMFVLSLVKKHYRLQFYMFNNDSNRFEVDCEPSDLFQLQDYTLPSVLQSLIGWETVRIYPFQIHSVALSAFASLMGPFGGFFASGFKRAFKIKVTSSGVSETRSGSDRYATGVSCPCLSDRMRGPNPSRVMQQLLALRLDQQLHIFNTLRAHLIEKGLLSAIEEAA